MEIVAAILAALLVVLALSLLVPLPTSSPPAHTATHEENNPPVAPQGDLDDETPLAPASWDDILPMERGSMTHESV